MKHIYRQGNGTKVEEGEIVQFSPMETEPDSNIEPLPESVSTEKIKEEYKATAQNLADATTLIHSLMQQYGTIIKDMKDTTHGIDKKYRGKKLLSFIKGLFRPKGKQLDYELDQVTGAAQSLVDALSEEQSKIEAAYEPLKSDKKKLEGLISNTDSQTNYDNSQNIASRVNYTGARI